MSLKTMKGLIGRCQSVSDLMEICRLANKRARLLRDRNRQKAAAQAWDATGRKAKTNMLLVLPEAKEVYCSVSIGGKPSTRKTVRFDAWTQLRVHQVQPRKKILWGVDEQDHYYALTPTLLAELDGKLYHSELEAAVAEHGAKYRQQEEAGVEARCPVC